MSIDTFLICPQSHSVGLGPELFVSLLSYLTTAFFLFKKWESEEEIPLIWPFRLETWLAH